MGDPPRLELKCFGPPTVAVDGAPPPPDVLWRKNLALLVYLSLSPGRTRSREHLVGLLWPEKDEHLARHSLNEAVRRLRLALGHDRLRVDGDAVTLADHDLHVDALDGASIPVQPFCEGFSVPDAAAFDRWLESERGRYGAWGITALLAAGEAALTASAFADARDRALTALELDPTNEQAVRLRMRAAALDGDSSGALRAYQEFVRRLREDFDLPVGAELRALADRVRRGEGGGERPGAGREADSPLVGRDRVHTTLFREVTAARTDGPRVIVIEGPLGAGKSRLLDECQRRWRLEGGTCALARPLETDRALPWAVLRQLVREGLGSAPGLRAAAPAALRMLAHVAPGLLTDIPDLVATEGDAVAALRDVIGAVAGEQPLCLAVDDAQWADDASLDAIRETLTSLPGVPLLLLVAEIERQEENPGTRRLRATIHRQLRGATMALEPLSDADVRLLVEQAAPWCEGPEQRDRLTRRVVSESSGSPLFAVTLLHGLAQVAELRDDAMVWPPPSVTLSAPLPPEVPRLVRDVIVARVATLDPRTRRILVIAAVGGPVLDAPVIAEIAELSAGELDQELFALERGRFIQFDGEHYRMAIPFLAAIVRETAITPSQRHRIERQYQERRQRGRQTTP